MTRGPARLAVLLLAASIVAAVSSAQANQGVIFSEIAFGPSLPPVGGNPMPSYIELVNVQIANPVVPPVAMIGTPGNPAIIIASVNGQPPVTFQIPLTSGTQGSPGVTVPTVLGGNVQGSPATPPPMLPAEPAVLLISSAPAGTQFPSGSGVPGNVIVIHAPALFSGPNAQLGAPGVPFDLCFTNPATGLSDRVHFGPTPAITCSAAPFTNTNTFVPTTGRALRWCYMDSNTDIDFEPTGQHSPGIVNPQMTHVNGFFFGTSVSTANQGVLLNQSGSPTSGTFFMPNTAKVKAVHFHKMGFPDHTIMNPAFDPIINAQVFMTANYTAQNPAISQPGFLPGLQILNEMMMIQAGTGFLNMPMNVSTQVGVNFGPSAASSDIRPERIFSDLVTDAAAFITGSGTAAAIDVIPPSAGDGNQWCEIIVFDYQGNEYRAKVKNWPQGGVCGGPLLALGTDGSGSCTILDLCFGPNAQIANLFSLSPPTGCPVGLLPPSGLCPDGITNWVLTPPQFGAAPFFAMTDAAGLYLYQVPTGTLLPFIGMTFYAIGVEYVPPATLVTQSAVTSIMF